MGEGLRERERSKLTTEPYTELSKHPEITD